MIRGTSRAPFSKEARWWNFESYRIVTYFWQVSALFPLKEILSFFLGGGGTETLRHLDRGRLRQKCSCWPCVFMLVVYVYLLEHGVWLHSLYSLSSFPRLPVALPLSRRHSRPPWTVVGLLHSRVRRWTPPPQVTGHWEYSDHVPQLPWTAKHEGGEMSTCRWMQGWVGAVYTGDEGVRENECLFACKIWNMKVPGQRNIGNPTSYKRLANTKRVQKIVWYFKKKRKEKKRKLWKERTKY